MIDLLLPVSFSIWIGFAIGWWASHKHAKDPTYFKTRLARLFNKD